MYRAGLTLCFVTVMLLSSFPSGAGPTDIVVSANFTYVPGDNDAPALALRVKRSQTLTYTNLDQAPHSIVSTETNPVTHLRLFNSGTKDFNQSGPVTGVENLPSRTAGYDFYCGIHGFSMSGKLFVDP